ncbi:hypothetical protein KC953_03710 [Candidatus Saccharibacteria bacterium]|nr:hypothetical protein [Candidatus Saccharibacteria bacterium]
MGISTTLLPELASDIVGDKLHADSIPAAITAVEVMTGTRLSFVVSP